MKIQFNLTGAKELLEAFNQLGEKSQKQVLRRGLTEASKIAVEAAKNSVPIETGELKESINAKVIIGKKKGFRAVIGCGEARHGSLIELGVPKYGYPPRPFLRPAIYNNHDAARAEFLNELEIAIKEAGIKEEAIKINAAEKSARKWTGRQQKANKVINKYKKIAGKKAMAFNKSFNKKVKSLKKSAKRNLKSFRKSVKKIF